MKKRVQLIIIALVGFVGSISGQEDFLLYSFDQLPQANSVNPAFRPSSKGYSAMPGVNTYMGIVHSGFKFKDLVMIRPDDSLELRPDNAIAKMSQLNYVKTMMNNELVSFGFQAKKSYLSFSITNKLSMRFMYPKDLFRLAFEGNGSSLLGERANMDGFGIDMLSYLEIAGGFNREFSDKLTIGGRLKYIQGLGTVYTKKSELGLHTDETTFDLTLDGQLAINTANTAIALDTNFTGFQVSDFTKLPNHGIGIDLGGVYKLNDKISLSASLLDLGVIKWNMNVSNFASDTVRFTFKGIDINEFLSDSSDVLQSIQDSLTGMFTYSSSNEAFITPLFTRFYVGGSYNLSEKIRVGANIYSEIVHSKYRGALTLSGNAKITNWFSAGMNYTYYSRDIFNIGLGFAINGGPVQFYVLSDNIIGLVSPHAAKNWHARFGFNFLIGWKQVDDKASLE